MKSMLQVTTLMLGVDEWFDYLMSWLSQAFCCVDARRQDDTVFQVTTLKLQECGLRMVRLPDAAFRRSVLLDVDSPFVKGILPAIRCYGLVVLIFFNMLLQDDTTKSKDWQMCW